MSGNVSAGILKPEPVKAAELIVKAPVPTEDKVRACGVAAVLTCTLPNAMLLELIPKVDTVAATAFSCNEVVFDTDPAVAVTVAVCVVVTDDTVALNPALVAFAGTITEAGTLTAVSLLDRATVSPPLGAAPVRLTVSGTVPDPVIEEPLQDNELKAALTVCFGAAFKFNWNHLVTPPPAAASTGVCALVTAEAVAVKTPVVEPFCTVTVAGTFTAELLLDKVNVMGEVAAELRRTVQASVPAPDNVAVLQ